MRKKQDENGQSKNKTILNTLSTCSLAIILERLKLKTLETPQLRFLDSTGNFLKTS